MWSVIELIETFFCNSYVVGIYERKTIVLFFVPKKTKQKWKEILTTSHFVFVDVLFYNTCVCFKSVYLSLSKMLTTYQVLKTIY